MKRVELTCRHGERHLPGARLAIRADRPGAREWGAPQRGPARERLSARLSATRLLLNGSRRPSDRTHFRRGGRTRGHHDRLLRGQAALLPRRRYRQAGGLRHRQRSGRGGGDAAGPIGRVHPRGRISDRRPAPDRPIDAGRMRGVGGADRDGRHQGRRARKGRWGFHHHDRYGNLSFARSMQVRCPLLRRVRAIAFSSRERSVIMGWRFSRCAKDSPLKRRSKAIALP